MFFRRQSKTFFTTCLLAIFLLPCLISAQDLPSEPVGYVNDFAGMLSGSERQQLEQKLRNYRDTTTTVIAIATIKSLNGISIEETATTLFNDWKMWEGNKDNGVLILAAEQDREMRIEVGYGLEGAIPDVMAGRIVRNIMSPNFRKGDFYTGFDRATSAIIQLASGEYTGQLTEENSEDDDLASFIIFVLFVLFVIYSSARKGGGKRNSRRRRRTLGSGGFIFMGGGGFGGGSSGGGSSFGGFSGGGGFGSGGGGASGGW